MSWRDAIGVLKDVLPQDMQSEEIIWCNRNGWSYDDYRAMKRLGVDPRDHESPIAAFEQALLQPEVVEAAAVALNEHRLVEGNSMGRWDEIYERAKEVYRQRARAALQAALAAAKGTEGRE